MHRPPIPALTGLRCVAALSVAVGHSLPVNLSVLGTSLHGLTGIGMPLFFTLSGFIIHYSYSDAFVSGWRGAAAEFSVARFSRIYPLYFAFLMLFLAVSAMGAALVRPDGLPLLFAYLFGVTTWLPVAIEGKLVSQWHYGISWSVSTELFFYLCYALFLYRIAMIRDLRLAVAALALFVLLAVAGFTAAFLTCDRWEPWAVAAFSELPPRMQDFNNSFVRWALYLSPYAQIPGFICGALTCQAHLLIQRNRSMDAFPANALAWSSVLGIGLLWMMSQRVGASGAWKNLNTPGDVFVALHMNMLLVPLCCTLMLAVAMRPTNIGTLLSTSTAVFLGEISYSIYLSHPIVVELAGRMPRPVPGVRFVVTLVALVAASAMLYRIVERPARRWLRSAWLEHLRHRGAEPALAVGGNHPHA